MAKLAIKGNYTRGEEVINILESLGGNNTNHLNGGYEPSAYTIDVNSCDADIYCLGAISEDYIVFTLEEFLKKFPYKIGDNVTLDNKLCIIMWMCWECDNIYYQVQEINGMFTKKVKVDELKPYKEQHYCQVDGNVISSEGINTSASTMPLLEELQEYLTSATPEQLEKDWEEIQISMANFKVGDKVIVSGFENLGEDEVISVFCTSDGELKYRTQNHQHCHYFTEDSLTLIKDTNMDKKHKGVATIGYIQELGSRDMELIIPYNQEIVFENGRYILRDKKPKYPKNYVECCKMLFGKTDFSDFELVLTKISVYTSFENSISPEPPYISEINTIYKLLICREAYWKIAGEEMGLNKPWEPTNETVYCISRSGNVIKSSYRGGKSNILEFPTEEMRDAFYNTFKGLIEQCKELL